MDVTLRVVRSTGGPYFTTLSTKENCPRWDYAVVGIGRAKPTQNLAIEEGRLAARRLGYKVVRMVRWRGPNKKSRIPRIQRSFSSFSILATRLKNQSNLPSNKFMRVIAREGSMLLILKEHTSLAKGAKLKRSKG
jgi:hypothetical protein